MEIINAIKRKSDHSPHGEVDAPSNPLPPGFKVTLAQPKVDSAATSHIVFSADFLDDYVTLNPYIRPGWGSSD